MVFAFESRATILVVAPAWLLLVVLGGVLLAAPSEAAPPRVRVIASDEIANEANSYATSELPFRSEAGHRLTLRLELEPEEVLNPHFDGELVPMPAEAVASALEELNSLPGVPLDLTLYCLPGLPREVSASHCVGAEIFLTPAFAEISAEVLAYTVVHEIGHALDHLRVRGHGSYAWSTYLRLRGLDPARHHDAAPAHRDRPSEIFAEDFRLLFGGPSARASGSHENPELVPPNEVEGLRSFFVGLLEGAYESGRMLAAVRNHPNPFNPRTSIEVELRSEQVLMGGTAQVEIYDLRGRRVRVFAPRAVEARMGFVWNGRDDAGRSVASGRYAYRVKMREGSVVGSMTLVR